MGAGKNRWTTKIGEVVEAWLLVGGLCVFLGALLAAATEGIFWLKLGHFPEWSPRDLGLWNPAQNPTGWDGLDQILGGIAKLPLPLFLVLIGLACLLLARVKDLIVKPA